MDKKTFLANLEYTSHNEKAAELESKKTELKDLNDQKFVEFRANERTLENIDEAMERIIKSNMSVEEKGERLRALKKQRAVLIARSFSAANDSKHLNRKIRDLDEQIEAKKNRNSDIEDELLHTTPPEPKN